MPPRFAADSILEAEDAGIELIICITEGIPAHDELRVYNTLKKNGRSRLVGPNCPGILSPGKASVGIIPASFFSAGNVGVVSRSGTLTYQIGNVLAQSGFGNSTIVGIGGDPVPGTDFIDVIGMFQEDDETELIVMCGEIGGDAEERAADFIADNVTKPVIGYIAGFTAPPGKTMGHAGGDRLRIPRHRGCQGRRRWRPRACASGGRPRRSPRQPSSCSAADPISETFARVLPPPAVRSPGMPEPSILDARLAEIDRRLRMIQSGLEPVRDDDDRLAAPEPPQLDPLETGGREPVAPTPLRAARMALPPGQADSGDEEVAVLTARLSELTAAHERLLATTQNLLVEQADMLARATPSVSVTAGPFTDMAALQEFRNALAELPQVREVAVREYVGSEGAVLDVHLQTPFS